MNYIKSRNWSVIIWEDRAPAGWQEVLEDICITRGMKAAISPIHNRDVWTNHDEGVNPTHKAGTKKPAHYHVLLTSPNGSVTENTMERLLSPLNANIKKITINDGGLSAQYDYLTHKYSLTKAQYEEDEIVLLNGFDPINIRAQSKTERVELRKKIRDIIVREKITNMIALERYLENEGLMYELSYIESNTYKVQTLLTANKEIVEKQKNIDFINEYQE